MEALNLFHRLVPGRQRRYRLHPEDINPGINRSMDSILDRLDGSKRRATYPNQSEVNIYQYNTIFFLYQRAIS